MYGGSRYHRECNTILMDNHLIDFENIEQKLKEAFASPEYKSLARKVNKAKRIFLIGNGGLHFVACHAATDMTRLIPDKSVYSFDSVGFITSNANDHPYDKLFIRWLDTIAQPEDADESLVIGMSCSGKSKNVLDALVWAQENGMDTFMISGKSAGVLPESVHELAVNCQYFHTVEVMSLMLFYDLVHRTGNRCPSIDQEIRRKFDE
jgi:D-sedoheptulose 7-phosphate isomerase